MNEKKRPFIRMAPNSTRSFIQYPPTNNQQKRPNFPSPLTNALPNLAPVDDTKSFTLLKTLYADVSYTNTQFINHSSTSLPYRAPLAVIIKDSDTHFQSFYSTITKIFGVVTTVQHSHSSLSKSITSAVLANTTIFNSQLINQRLVSEPNQVGQNLTEANIKTIKSVTEPFLIDYVKLSNQIFAVKDSGFNSIIEDLTKLFNIVFSIIEKLGNLPSNGSNVRENSKKISMMLKTNANQLHGSIRKHINTSSSQESGDNEQRLKQIIGMIHDFSQMLSNSITNDFTASISPQESNTIRSDVLTTLNDMIQSVRSASLFVPDITSIISAMSKFETKLKPFVFGLGISFPNEEEIKNGRYFHDNENEGIIGENTNNSDTQCSFDKNSILSEINDKEKEASEKSDDNITLDFDESMNVYELIQVAEKVFPKSLAIYSQDLSSSMMRFLSLLRGKLGEYEVNFKKVNTNNNEVEIKRIKKMNDLKVKQLENTIKSLNNSILTKNKDIDFFQNGPSMQYLQDIVSLLYLEEGQPKSQMTISEVDLIDPFFMKKITDRINTLKGRKADESLKKSDDDQIENAKKKLMQILEDSQEQNSSANEEGILALIDKCQLKINDLKQGIEKSNEKMENIRKFTANLKESLNELTSAFPSLTDDINSLSSVENDQFVDQNALKIIDLLKKSIENEKLKKSESDSNLNLLNLVIQKLSKFLGVSPPSKPVAESVEDLLKELENR